MMNQRALRTKSLLPRVAVAIVAFLAFTQFALAQTVVLVPGYLGDAGTWRANGVTRALAAQGWQDAGHILPGRAGPLMPRLAPAADRRFFTVDLPTEAPLQVQASVLVGQLAAVRARYPSDTLVVVGHSAGGVVARLAMVQRPALAVSMLVTLSTPHLGTGLAETGLKVGNSPLSWFAPMVGGGTINRSQALYRDLVRERPGSLLFWLNRQPHPEAQYVSVVRAQRGTAGWRDSVVPPYSQDMNNVPALRGKSQLIRSPNGHGVHPADAGMLIKLLNENSSA